MLILSGGAEIKPPFDIRYSYWFNPELDYKTYMVPGILVLLVTIIGMFLSSMNVVREKEMGTIEQINVSPVKKYQFVIGKLLPFWFIALFELAFGLTLARIIFGYSDYRKPVADFRSGIGVFAGRAGHRTFYFHIGKYTAAGHVPGLVFCRGFYYDERFVYAC